MKTTSLFILIQVCLTMNLSAQKIIPDLGILSRVYQVTFPEGLIGSCIVINQNNFEYLVTAKHLLKDKGESAKSGSVVSFKIFKSEQLVEFKGTLLLHDNPDVDLAVIRLGQVKDSDDNFLTSTTIGLFDDAIILGFPLGLSLAGSDKINGGYNMPFGKKGIVAGNTRINDVRYFVLDIYNNVGFSGGPAFIKIENKWYLIGIINGYFHTNHQIGDGSFKENSGLTLITDVAHLKQILNQ